MVRACARPYFLAGGDSEDLIQEGMLGLLNAVRDYRADRNTAFRTYAQICIKRRLISAIRSDARYKNLPLNKAVSYHPFSFDCEDSIPQQSVPDPEEVLIGQEQADERTAQLKKELSGLEEKVLELYLDGYSCSEIAHSLGREIKAVDNAIQRVRRKALRLFNTATTA
ncbi:MAG: sigma-70 family RNA polymerase sigma factor [Oscillospiraceae bacterium]|nr:sigma-70 family RNA polymerase sigma factor [Oscillospiraceae bacterium]